jgi:hypothetical protein
VLADGTLTVDCSADLIVIDLQVCPRCKARVLLYVLKDHTNHTYNIYQQTTSHPHILIQPRHTTIMTTNVIFPYKKDHTLEQYDTTFKWQQGNTKYEIL